MSRYGGWQGRNEGNTTRRKREARIPLSLALMTAGMILLVTVGVIYAVAPVAPPPNLPDLIPRARVPTVAPTPRPLPTLMSWQEEQGAGASILVPHSAPGASLPSLARADQAPVAVRNAVGGQPVGLEIPALGIRAPILPVGLEQVRVDNEIFQRWQAPTFYAAGWHNNSALLGEKGNTVLNGHHNIYGEIFRDLENLEVGDEIVVYDQERTYYYRVQEQHILLEKDQPLTVRQENARWILPTPDERLTLVTCWPYTDNTHRLIVIAIPSG